MSIRSASIGRYEEGAAPLPSGQGQERTRFPRIDRQTRRNRRGQHSRRTHRFRQELFHRLVAIANGLTQRHSQADRGGQEHPEDHPRNETGGRRPLAAVPGRDHRRPSVRGGTREGGMASLAEQRGVATLIPCSLAENARRQLGGRRADDLRPRPRGRVQLQPDQSRRPPHERTSLPTSSQSACEQLVARATFYFARRDTEIRRVRHRSPPTGPPRRTRASSPRKSSTTFWPKTIRSRLHLRHFQRVQVSAMTQTPVIKQLLPVVPPEVQDAADRSGDFIYEPSKASLLEHARAAVRSRTRSSVQSSSRSLLSSVRV